MTLQLTFLLDASFDKHISIWDYGFGEKKLFKPNVKLRNKSYIQWMKKPSKLDEKTKRKTKSSIDKKSLKLNKKTRKKTDHLIFCNVTL